MMDGSLVGSISFATCIDKYEARSLIDLVNRELYDWDDISLLDLQYMTREEWHRLDDSIQSRNIRRKALDKGNMIWRWLYYGSPDFKEFENPSCESREKQKLRVNE